MTNPHPDGPVLIVTGGTGGHLFPALATAEEILARHRPCFLVLAGDRARRYQGSIEAAGITPLHAGAVRLPSSPVAALTFPFRYRALVREARDLLGRVRPRVVLGMGSFTCAPVCGAAQALGIPVVLHEGNAWVGRANRFLSRRARVLALSFAAGNVGRTACETVVTGMPVRRALVAAAEAGAGPDPGYLMPLGLSPELPLLLVFGGSQGAIFINRTVAAAMAALSDLRERFQVLHLTGYAENDEILSAYLTAGIRAAVLEREEHMNLAYAATGLCICRAGASSLAELALFGCPAVLIPLPSAAENHQEANARIAASAGGARLLPQAQADPEAVGALIRQWAAGEAPWRDMGSYMARLARPHAAAELLAVLDRAAEGQP
jgi:UDP-N-acetylglucosamine--N-acetylmuramyl-(pentapeptide) pyrophosphoryl-undecaprenol N-acetylglucosamine transferase